MTHWRCVRRDERAKSRCRRCAAQMQRSGSSLCVRCTTHPPEFLLTYVGADYVAPYDELMKSLKFSRQLPVARALGRLLEAAIPTDVFVDSVVPVPAWPERLAERGFNAAALIAEVLARRRSWHLDVLGLRQVRAMPMQHFLHAAERENVVQGAFGATRSWLGKTVAVLDDVMTTGATLNAAARALSAAGAKKVVALAALRTTWEK